MCLIRTSDNSLAAGFTSASWDSPRGTSVFDASAMVFALTDTLQVYKTKNPKSAVGHYKGYGPIW